MSRRRKSDQQQPQEPQEKRDYVQSGVVVEPAIKCYHCQAESHAHRITHTYNNGNRRRICAACGKPFISRRKVA